MSATFLNWLKVLFGGEPTRTPRTHALQLDGVTAGRLDDNEDGLKLHLCVFRTGCPWEAGDFLIVRSTSGQESRYKIDQIWTPHDPGNQHFLYLSFAPRSEGSRP